MRIPGDGHRGDERELCADGATAAAGGVEIITLDSCQGSCAPAVDSRSRTLVPQGEMPQGCNGGLGCSEAAGLRGSREMP